MNKRKIFGYSILIFSILSATFFFYIYQIVKSPNILFQKENKVLVIQEGTSWKQLQKQLFQEGFVKRESMIAFGFCAKIMSYPENIKEGRYLLKKNSTFIEAIKILRNGLQEPVKLTFNNVRLKEELAEKLTKNIKAKPEEVLALLNDQVYLETLGFDTLSVTNMFIPDTYHIYWTYDAKKLMERMKKEYDKFWAKDGRLEKAQALNLTPNEVAIVASIVQGETYRNDEKPVIAGLYLNRVRKGIKLQADPTVKYAVGDFSLKRVLKKHTEVESPYNTYFIKGLPIGPICVPSKESIDAVLNSKEHDYIYMCGKGDGSGYHNFAQTLDEHNRNKRKFIRNAYGR
ncbi:MAG: endolytic transglycosylase MltG [Cytophagales bacterium]|nr:endolytic transglycosylase MltG [Cytophagales bacterium]